MYFVSWLLCGFVCAASLPRTDSDPAVLTLLTRVTTSLFRPLQQTLRDDPSFAHSRQVEAVSRSLSRSRLPRSGVDARGQRLLVFLEAVLELDILAGSALERSIVHFEVGGLELMWSDIRRLCVRLLDIVADSSGLGAENDMRFLYLLRQVVPRERWIFSTGKTGLASTTCTTGLATQSVFTYRGRRLQSIPPLGAECGAERTGGKKWHDFSSEYWI